MKNSIYLFVILFAVLCNSMTAQTKSLVLDSLKQQVSRSNDLLKYDSSLQLISNFLKNGTVKPYDRYFAWILKSYTHKRLFDYKEALRSLDSAASEGMHSNRKQETAAHIKAEKAFIYFDTQSYEKSAQLMRELKDTNYKFIPLEDQSIIVMQLGYIAFLNGDFIKAEKHYDAAIALMQNTAERNLPIIYGKKVELYGIMHLTEKRNTAFAVGLRLAEKHQILKYKMYMYETLYKQFIKNGEYKEAYFADRKLDSLTYLYNAEQTKYNLQLNDKKLELIQKEASIKQKNYLLWFVLCLAICFILISSLIYYLLLSRKKSHQLLEADYNRIFEELYLLTQTTEEKKNSLSNLSKFKLSERQREIIELLKQGKSNKQIAESLFISENTVKYHLKSIYELFNINNRVAFFKIFST